MGLDIEKKLLVQSERVKCLDVHSSEPWILTSLYNGTIEIRNYRTQKLVKTFDILLFDMPIRAGRFVARKKWIVCGADDMCIRVFNYNTSEKEKVFEAHQDFIRFIDVHATKPFILTCSDDMTIKLWDWSKNWQCITVFEGHTHYVMMCKFNPKNPNSFASCSLDGKIRFWGLNTSEPYFTLEGHTDGVNAIDFYHGNDKPYLVSGSDDKTVRVWDYQSKSTVQILQQHTENVTCVAYHPKLPVIVSGGEDSLVNLWNSNTYTLEKTMNYGLDRVWCLGYSNNTKIAIGFDKGSIVLKLGDANPVVTMNEKKGKLIVAVDKTIQQWSAEESLFVVKSSKSKKITKDAEDEEEESQKDVKTSTEDVKKTEDGEEVPFLNRKDLGGLDFFPKEMLFDSTGRNIAMIGVGEYGIYTSVNFSSKVYGKGEQFIWGPKAGQFAVLDASSSTSKNILLFKNFKEFKTIKPFDKPEKLFGGGDLLGVRTKEFVSFYDWNSGEFIRSIGGVAPKQIVWNENGTMVAFICNESLFFLRYDSAAVKQGLKQGNIPEDGVNCFEVEDQLTEEQVRDGFWVGECFIFLNHNKALNYFVGGEVKNVANLQSTHYLLGFVPKYNRVFLMDKEYRVVSYELNVSVMQYEAAIVRGDFEAAQSLFSEIPEKFHNALAKFLEIRNYLRLALQISKDPEHQFELAIKLDELDIAFELASKSKELQLQKWRQLGGVSLSKGKFAMAEECFSKGKDLNGLLLIYTSLGKKNKLLELTKEAEKLGKKNVSFIVNFVSGETLNCLDVLMKENRFSEAAIFAKTYVPEKFAEIEAIWQEKLKEKKVSAK